MDELASSFRDDKLVLDVGCGSGSFDYGSYKFKILGVDNTLPTKKNSGNSQFVLANADKLPFKSELFDVLFFNWVLEHVEYPEKCLIEAESVLKKGGCLYVSIPDSSGFDDRLYRMLYKGGGHIQKFNFESFIKIVYGSTGFKLLSII